MYRSIRERCGLIGEVQICPDSPGIRVSRKFIRSIIKNFAGWNKDFHKCAGILPVILRERQLSGGLFQAILQAGAQALSEPPIKRKRWGVPEKRGWADFVAYLGNTMWLFEVKHSYCKLNFFKKTEIEWLTGDWNDAFQKIKSFKKSVLRDWGDGWNTSFGVAFHIVLIYQQHKKESNVHIVKGKDIIKYIDLLKNHLHPKPNWVWLWLLSNGMQKPEKINENWENYPAVCFFLYIKSLN